MDNINIYNDSAIILSKKIPKSSKIWIIMVLFFFLTLTVIFSIPFNKYKTFIGQVIINNDISYLSIKLEKCDFPINKSNKLFIKRSEYHYEIESIEENQVILKLKLDESLKIDNNYMLVNILSDRTTIIEIIKENLKKGFGL